MRGNPFMASITEDRRADVPCGPCRACCTNNLILLLAEDDVASYEHVIMTPPGMDMSGPVLKQKPNGDCVYLDRATGCTIHERAPKVCQSFDCRGFYLMHSRRDRKEMAGRSKHTKAIFEAAAARIPPEVKRGWAERKALME